MWNELQRDLQCTNPRCESRTGKQASQEPFFNVMVTTYADRSLAQGLNKLDTLQFVCGMCGARAQEEQKMIVIKKSSTADTRTCDYTKVDREQLLSSSRQHIADVKKGIEFFQTLLATAANNHDHDKLTGLRKFYNDFLTGFAQTAWLDNHRKVNRHHLLEEEGIPEDVNLIDVLEMIADCVLAGMGRAGKVNLEYMDLSPALLTKAFYNTIELLTAQITVAEDEE